MTLGRAIQQILLSVAQPFTNCYILRMLTKVIIYHADTYPKDDLSCWYILTQKTIVMLIQSQKMIYHADTYPKDNLSSWYIQLCSKLFNPLSGFPMISIVNKSCNTECCVYNMFRINKKMIVSPGLELILSV